MNLVVMLIMWIVGGSGSESRVREELERCCSNVSDYVLSRVSGVGEGWMGLMGLFEYRGFGEEGFRLDFRYK